MTRTPAQPLSAEELAIVARFDAAPVPAEVVVERIRALHTPDGSQNPWCDHDGYSWPCPTVSAWATR